MQFIQSNSKALIFILTLIFALPSAAMASDPNDPNLPSISVSKTAISFSAYAGGSNPATQTLSVSNSGGGTVNWSIDTGGKPAWLTIAPTGGSLEQGQSETVALSADITGLSDGQYTYTFQVYDPAAKNNPQPVIAKLEVIGPILNVSSNLFSFSNRNLHDQTFIIQNTGGGLMNWSMDLAAKPDWLMVTPTNGQLAHNESDTITLSVDINGLSDAQHSCTFNVLDPAARNSPQSVLMSFKWVHFLSPRTTLQFKRLLMRL